MIIDTAERFLFWCMIINVSIMILIFVTVMTCRTLILKIHSKLFNVPQEFVAKFIYSSLGLYKLLTFFFVVIPWIALKIASN